MPKIEHPQARPLTNLLKIACLCKSAFSVPASSFSCNSWRSPHSYNAIELGVNFRIDAEPSSCSYLGHRRIF